MTGRSIAEILQDARAGLDRVSAEQAFAELQSGDAILVDLRERHQREGEGAIDGAVEHSRLVIEWRADPQGEFRDPRIADPDARVILFCNHGYSSSLAAATLREMGLQRATDIIGGFEAWAAAGLPVVSR